MRVLKGHYARGHNKKGEKQSRNYLLGSWAETKGMGTRR